MPRLSGAPDKVTLEAWKEKWERGERPADLLALINSTEPLGPDEMDMDFGTESIGLTVERIKAWPIAFWLRTTESTGPR